MSATLPCLVSPEDDMSQKRLTKKQGSSIARGDRRIRLNNGDLVILPCTKGKEGRRTDWPEKRLRDFLGSHAAEVLRNGRKDAFKCRRTRLLPRLTRMALLDMYSGHLYPPSFKKLLRRLLERQVYVLIFTGGYGLGHPQERKRKYEANLSATAKVWRTKLPVILNDFVTRNHVERVFIGCSRSYAAVLNSGTDTWAGHVPVFWYTPRGRPGHGNRAEDIARQIRLAVRALSRTGKPDARWTRGPKPGLGQRRCPATA
jgi:hypothetical protein